MRRVASRSATSVVRVTATGCVIGAVIAVSLLRFAEGDPTVFLHIGSPPIRQHIENVMGRPVAVAPGLGHDGQHFYVQALDPWIQDPESYEALLDRPRYRAGRVGYPMLAGLAGMVSPVALPWSMVVVNLIAMACGTFALADLALRLGRSPWLGLAFALNPAMWFELMIGGGGVVAWAAAIGGISAMIRGKLVLSGALLALAVLSRETMLLVVAGAALWWWSRYRELPTRMIALATIVPMIWAGYVVWRLGTGGPGHGASLGHPFVGLVEAAPMWDLLSGATAVALVFAGTYVVVRAMRDSHLLATCTAGFVVLMPFLVAPIWWEPFDSTRALAPLVTASLFALAERLNEGEGDRESR